LEPEFSEQQVLVNLGLTLKQARIYIALAKSGLSRINEISRTSKVARTDVYSALEKLQRIGLVEKLIQTPPSYRAIPLKEGLALLLETRTQQYEKTRAETEILQNTLEKGTPEETIQTKNSEFVLVPQGRPVLDRIRNAIETAQQSIDLLVSWKRFSTGIADTFADNIEKAWTKKVKIRIIVEMPPRDKTSEQLVKFFSGRPSSQIRFVSGQPKTVFGIYDKKQVFVIVISKEDLLGSPALWSDNDALISLASDLFEVLWLTASENPN
jgi:HTH-type transcriptional regulator, sugar sensing transcriptional regulator